MRARRKSTELQQLGQAPRSWIKNARSKSQKLAREAQMQNSRDDEPNPAVPCRSRSRPQFNL